MSNPVEFSSFYTLLNAIKEGDEEKIDTLNKLLGQYKTGELAKSFLEELGQLYIFIGVDELYKYTNQQNIKNIGAIDKEGWETLSEENEADLPKYLANEMVKYFQQNKISSILATKWNVREREVKKHTTQMARYVVEGILDVLE